MLEHAFLLIAWVGQVALGLQAFIRARHASSCLLLISDSITLAPNELYGVQGNPATYRDTSGAGTNTRLVIWCDMENPNQLNCNYYTRSPFPQDADCSASGRSCWTFAGCWIVSLNARVIIEVTIDAGNGSWKHSAKTLQDLEIVFQKLLLLGVDLWCRPNLLQLPRCAISTLSTDVFVWWSNFCGFRKRDQVANAQGTLICQLPQIRAARP
jgi:hypothetical protein